MAVSEYIITEIEYEEFEFINPVYKKIYNEFLDFYTQGKIMDEKHFIHHAESQISKLAADIYTVPHQLSKIWSKGGNIANTLEIILEKAVPEFIIKYKLKHLELEVISLELELRIIEEKKETEKMIELLQKKMVIDELKKNLAKALGDVIII
jgi:replicative DNA helicase